jgi:acetoin utilization protein AcuB
MNMNHSPVPSVADYMTPGPTVVGAHQSLPTAHQIMREHGIRHLPVVDGGLLVGILSDRDLHLVQTLAHVRPEQLTFEDAMTADPYTVSITTPLNQVARVMSERKIGSAVVVEHGGVVGVFTVTDALEALIEALEGTYTRRRFEGVTTEPPTPRHPNDLR